MNKIVFSSYEEGVEILNRNKGLDIPSFYDFFFSTSALSNSEDKIKLFILYFKKIEYLSKLDNESLTEVKFKLIEKKNYDVIGRIFYSDENYGKLIDFLEKRLLFKKSLYHFKLNQLVELECWDNAFSSTGEGFRRNELKSSKGRIKVVDFLEITFISLNFYIQNKNTEENWFSDYTVITPSYGKYKDCHIYIPLRNIKFKKS